MFFIFQVAEKIKLSGNQLSLLVVDGGMYEKAVSRGQNPRGLTSIRRGEGCKPPRLCHIPKDPVSGLGINFTPVEGSSITGHHGSSVPNEGGSVNIAPPLCCAGEKGRFSVNLISGGAAEKAGVRRGDHLVWMDGAAVSDLTHAALSLMVRHVFLCYISSCASFPKRVKAAFKYQS